jgi:RecA/RadA recombinase
MGTVTSIKDKFKKKIQGSKTISMDDPTPDFWLSTGNRVMNKIISGRFSRGFPQGRIAGIAGPSGAGKSFIVANTIAQAQREGYMILVVDSENALDSDYLSACGVDTSEDNPMYIHVSVSTLSSAAEAIHSLTEDYHEARVKKTLDEMPRLLIVIDSLDFLFTDSMMAKFEDAGELGNDQGLHARKMKQLLQSLVADIKFLPAIAVCTKQVYVDQNPQVQVPWKMSEAAKFAFTQILLVTRIMDRDATTKEYNGIKLRVFGWKTRGCQPFQRCEIVVPYSTGLDEYEGILPVAVSMGIVEKGGSWYTYGEHKWQGEAKWHPHKEAIFAEIAKREDLFIDVAEGEEEDGPKAKDATKAKKGALGDAVSRIAARKGKGDATEASETAETGE